MADNTLDKFHEPLPEPSKFEVRYLTEECQICGHPGLLKCMETGRVNCIICEDVNYSRTDSRMFFYQQGCKFIRIEK
jgi:hypothetical protein